MGPRGSAVLPGWGRHVVAHEVLDPNHRDAPKDEFLGRVTEPSLVERPRN